MKISGRRVAKWALWAAVVLVTICVLYLSVFFVPYPLFPHHLEAHGFDVYSDSEIPADFDPVLEDARVRLEAMELYRGEKPLRIFVCQSHDLFTFLVKAAGKRHAGQGLLISVAGNAFFSEKMIEEIGRRNGGRPEHSRLQGSWSAAIAHELAHALVFTEVGFRSARRMPVWKSEGYADYQANKAAIDADPDYDLRRRITYLLDDKRWTSPTAYVDRRHFGWQLEVEWLCEIRGLDFEALMDAAISDDRARAEMFQWHRRQSADGDS